MGHHVYETDARCDACGGTGLYVGVAERDGAAVVCVRCGGSGTRVLRMEWDDFEGRAVRKGVKRVYRTNPGICIGESTDPVGRIVLEDFGGMPYGDWLSERPWPDGSEDREHTCPAWWYQAADYKLKPEWDECDSSLGRTFRGCQSFRFKRRCWSRWDRERRGAGGGEG